jgi:hypothetical protein
VVIGGVSFCKLLAKTINRPVESLSKYRRISFPQAELVKLRAQATEQVLRNQKIEALPNNFGDPKQLSDVQHLDSLLEACVKHLKDFDMLDVFHKVFPDAAGNLETDSIRNPRGMNLFTHFTKLELSQVTESNRWCSTYTDDRVAFRDLTNLQFREVSKQIHHSRITKGIGLHVTCGKKSGYRVSAFQHRYVLQDHEHGGVVLSKDTWQQLDNFIDKLEI